MKQRNNAEMTAFVQRAMLDKSGETVSDVHNALRNIKATQNLQKSSIDDFNAFLDDINNAIDENDISSDTTVERISKFSGWNNSVKVNDFEFQYIETVDISNNSSEFYDNIEAYAQRNGIDFSRPLSSLLGSADLEALRKKIDEDFTFKNPQCDAYDYLIAGICGALGALIDIFGVGAPGEGVIGKATDSFFDRSVEKIASWNGWEGPREGKSATASAIGFLERKFIVPYDFATTQSTDGLVGNMSMSNHHIKSLAHSPDPIGLFFSILDQFYGQGSFISNGQLVVVEKSSNNNFELKGGNIPAKICCAFFNWIMHIASDMAGSSGASGRGSGVAMPFQNLLTCIKFGEFGQYKHDLGTVFTQVFESGYDLRHGVAMAIPVIVTGIMIRFLYTLRRRFAFNMSWKEALSNSPELQRMLFVGQGILCVGDSVDAYVRSGGEIVQFLLRTNLVAWVNFGRLAYKELFVMLNAGHVDVEKIDKYIDNEYHRILTNYI